eukprot:5699501-Pleurochrysis_carterae.AAC.1
MLGLRLTVIRPLWPSIRLSCPRHSCSAIRALSFAWFTRAHVAFTPLLIALPVDPFALLSTAFASGYLLLIQTLFAVQSRA